MLNLLLVLATEEQKKNLVVQAMAVVNGHYHTVYYIWWGTRNFMISL